MQCMSKLFNKQEVVLVIGSGSSLPHVPGVGTVTAALRAWTKYVIPTQPRMPWPQLMDAIEGTGQPGQVRYFDALYGALASSFEEPQRFLHFERLIYAAQQIDHFTTEMLDPAASDYAKGIVGPLLEFRAGMSAFDNRFHSMIASEASTFVLNHVGSAESALGAEFSKALPFNQFLSSLGKKRAIRIFSLNYDTLALGCRLDFQTGFLPNTPGAAVGRFKPSALLTTHAKNVFCQLHGSCLFGFTNANVDSPEDMFVRHASLPAAHDSRLHTATDAPAAQDGTSATSRLMITGMRKADAIQQEPFASYFRLLFDDLLRVPTWVFAGYGGTDLHLNLLIERAYRVWRERGKKVRVLWVGFAPDACFDRGETRMDPGNPIWDFSSSAFSAVFPQKVIDAFAGVGRVLREQVQYVNTEDVDVCLSFRGTDATFSHHSDEVMKFLS